MYGLGPYDNTAQLSSSWGTVAFGTLEKIKGNWSVQIKGLQHVGSVYPARSNDAHDWAGLGFAFSLRPTA